MLTLSFLFDNYGLYPSGIVNNSFIMDDNIYQIEEIRGYVENDFISLSTFSLELYNLFKMSFKINKNRRNEYITRYSNKEYVLISTPLNKVTYYDVIKFSKTYTNKEYKKYTISQMLDVWLERYSNIKDNCFKSLSNDDINYNNIALATAFSFGLAENALSYLSDAKIDYGNEINRIALSHIRLNLLDSYSFLNPLNMIYDSVIRDYAELYKFELIDIQELNKVLDQLNLTKKEASLLMARIMYPTRLFDLLEDTYLSEEHKISKTVEYVKCLDKELQRIKNVHILLIKKYNIRPIKWLK